MSPEDPRHGSYAGYQEHRKTDTAACADCQEAKRIYVKRMKLRVAKGIHTRAPISEEAWAKVQAWNPEQLARATGMRATTINHIRSRGPEGLILVATEQRILAAVPAFTTIGIRRRIQALSAIGYSCSRIAAEVGSWPDAIRRIRRGARDGIYTRHEFGLAVCRVYDRLQATPLPPSKSATRARNEAETNGWVSAMGWDDIDHDLYPIDDVRPDGAPFWWGYRYPAAELVLEWDHLRRSGVSIDHAASQLGVGVEAIEKAIERARKAAA